MVPEVRPKAAQRPLARPRPFLMLFNRLRAFRRASLRTRAEGRPKIKHRFWSLGGPRDAILVSFWLHFGYQGGHLDAILLHLGCLGSLGDPLGPLWGPLGAPKAHLGTSMAPWGVPEAPCGGSWGTPGESGPAFWLYFLSFL